MSQATVQGTVNMVFLLGHVGQDPEIKLINAGTALTKFTLATNRLGAKNAEGQRSVEADWHRIECWGRLAEQVVEMVKRGSRVQVTGTLKQDKWTDSEGKARTSTVIVASDVVFLDRRAGHAVAEEGDDDVVSVAATSDPEDEPAF